MDRLTTGRRHLRAGSVTVTELLSRQASTTRCGSPTEPDNNITDITAAADGREEDAVTDTIPAVVETGQHREPTRGVQLVKLASLGVAGVVLCGAVTISTLVAHQRREATHSAHRPTPQITGEQALLPDKLDETLPEPATPAVVPRQDRPLAVPDVPAPEPAPNTSPQEPATPDSGTTASGGALSSAPVSDEALVREFYAKLPESPVAAFDLLSPDVLDTSLGEFLASWTKVVAIDSVDVRPRKDGVHATVRMRLADGGQLRVEQLLTVAESPRRIVGVQLLSAQRN